MNRSVSVEKGIITYRDLGNDIQEDAICAQYSGLDFIN